MKLNISLIAVLNLLWILQVSSKALNNNENIYPQSRIVGGNNANANQFPYQVSVQGGGVLCGGSIISRNYIITAAHCVSSRPASSITIRAGTTQLRSGGITIGVSEVKSHPNYGNFNNDIAVLKLARPLNINDSIKPIALATRNPSPGSVIVVSGWGGIYNGGPISETLKYNVLQALSLDECKRRLNPLPSTVICFGHTSGNGVCGGDSGGPGVYNNQLVGVTNYVVGGCGSNNPDAFASVADLNQWIRDNTDL